MKRRFECRYPGCPHFFEEDPDQLMKNGMTNAEWFESVDGMCLDHRGMTPPDPALSANHTVVSKNPQVTSAAAAKRAFPKSGTQRHDVFCFIARRGGATDEEIQMGMGISPNSERPRRGELVEDGFIEDSGRTRQQATTGNEAIVWVLTAKGQAEWDKIQVLV
jgi:hypothetical protein